VPAVAVRRVAAHVRVRLPLELLHDRPVPEILQLRDVVRRVPRLVDEPLPAVVGEFKPPRNELLLRIVYHDRVVCDRTNVIVVPVRRLVAVVRPRVDRQVPLVIYHDRVRVPVTVVVQVVRRTLERRHRPAPRPVDPLTRLRNLQVPVPP